MILLKDIVLELRSNSELNLKISAIKRAKKKVGNDFLNKKLQILFVFLTVDVCIWDSY